MGTASVNPSVANGVVINNTHVNDLAAALCGDFVGRNAAGVATADQSLGTAAVPWGVLYADSLVLSSGAIGTVPVPATRIVSALARGFGGDHNPAFLTPDGTVATADLLTSDVFGDYPFVAVLKGLPLTVAADDSFTSLTLAPSSNNTCLVNDVDLADQDLSKLIGERRVTVVNRKELELTVDTMGSEITALVGTWQYFKFSTEVFLAYVKSTTVLSYLKRGAAATTREVISNNDTITLLKASYCFLNYVSATTYTKDTTTRRPDVNLQETFTPATGDYYWETPRQGSVGTWKEWNGSAWVNKQAILLGAAICDTAGCKWTDQEEVFALHSGEMDINWELFDTGAGTSKSVSQIGAWGYVNGVKQSMEFGRFCVDTSILVAAGVGYVYLDYRGEVIADAVAPRFNYVKNGWYHPTYVYWRCVGYCIVNSSLDTTGISSYSNSQYPGMQGEVRLTGSGAAGLGHGSTNTRIRRFLNTVRNVGAAITYADSATLGGSFVINEEGDYAITYGDRSSTDPRFGISVNSTQLTTSIESITAANRLISTQGPASTIQVCTITVHLYPGDTIRAHDNNAGDVTDATSVYFNIAKVR